MAKIMLNYQSKVYLDLVPCSEVLLCLADGWEAKTVSGFKTVKATVANAMRDLGSLGLMGRPKWNVRGQDVVQYTFSVDDTQFIDNPATNDPYVLTCTDIVSVDPFPCAVNAVQENLDERVDAIENA